MFTKTAEFRHDSIPAAIQAVQQLGAQNGFGVDQTEDARRLHRLEPRPLPGRDVPAHDGRRAERHAAGGVPALRRGRRRLRRRPLGGRHRARLALVRRARRRVLREPPGDPDARRSTSPTRATPRPRRCRRSWTRTDEWYNFTSEPAVVVHVLATLDETTYDPGDGAMGADHPIAWWHAYDGGRAWYTGLGPHRREPTPSRCSSRSCSAGSGTPPAPPAPAVPSLRIASLTAAASRGRVRVVVEVTGCGACSGGVTSRKGLGEAPVRRRHRDRGTHDASLPAAAGCSSS